MTAILGNWNGVISPLDEIKVSVLDRAFLFGDALYEVIRVYSGKLFHIEDHLERLRSSLQKVDLVGVDIDEVRNRLEATLSASGVNDALVYIQITRGVAPRAHYYPDAYEPNILIFVTPFEDPFADDRATGVGAVTHTDLRWARNDIKSTSLQANCMAAQFARSNNCMEVVFIDRDGLMTEGSHTSLFGIKDGNLIVAPASTNVLPGITKKQILDLASQCEIPIVEDRLRENQIYQLDEFFLAGTPEELISIVRVNESVIGDGKPGPIVKKLHEAFRKSLARELSQQAR
ncbi:MAG: aminotransferase class IV [Cyanobacteria bacterium]|nr:aminotransferase class IV [Cyanobacteriota bacterium]